MEKIKIVCPKCGEISLVDPEDTGAKCTKCGASLAINRVVETKTLQRKERKIASNLARAESYVKNEEWDALRKLVPVLKEESPESFSTYAFMLMGHCHHDFYHSSPRVIYRLGSEAVQDDIKSRLYFYARKKYSKCTEMTLHTLNAFYPDYHDESDDTYHKAKSKYDELLAGLLSQKSHIEYLKRDELPHLIQYAVTNKEKTFLKNVNTFIEEVETGLALLKNYDKEADAFVYLDYRKTPRPGNKPKFMVSLTAMVLSAFILVISALEMAFSLTQMSWFFPYPALSSALLRFLLIVMVMVYLFIREKPFVKKHKASIMILFSLFLLTGITDIVLSWRLQNFIACTVFAVLGIVLAILSLSFALYFFFMYLPHNTYKCGSYIGNFKALSANHFDVDFSFNWDGNIKGEKKTRKRMQHDIQRER